MTEPPAGGPEHRPALRRLRRRRRLPVYLALLGLLVTVAAVGLTHTAARSRAAGTGPAPAEPAQTAEVVRRDLVEQVRVTASVGYGVSTRLTGRKPGTLTWLPQPGTVVERGQHVYRVDDVPVPLFLGAAPLYRPLAEGVPDGADVRMLQENLDALGFGLEVDGVYGPATAAAVEDWQDSLGVPATGEVKPADVVVLPGAVRVGALSAQLGDQGQAALMTVTGIDRVAVAKVEPGRQALLRPGTSATVTATALAGPLVATVASLEPEAQGDPQAGGSRDAQKILATFRFEDQAAAAALLDGASVTVSVESERHEDVLAVPVGALLALIEGGYAVELVTDGGRRLLAVRTGLFSDGLVEVSGDGLAEGMRVVIAS